MDTNHPVPVVAIVVAAGSGSRLGADVPKALVPVAGVPLVVRAIRQLAAGGVDAVVAVVPVSDTVPELTDAGSTVVDRARLRGVQTPQGFRRGILEDAHVALHETGTPVTDDAAAAETLDEAALQRAPFLDLSRKPPKKRGRK